MTLIVGIQCSDGVVVASDGMATFGAMGEFTIRQDTRKLTIIEDRLIIGVSGHIGLAQRFTGALEKAWKSDKDFWKVPRHDQMQRLRTMLGQYVAPEAAAARELAPVIGQAAMMGALSSTVIALPMLDKKPGIIHFDQNCSPECTTNENPFVAIGSGQKMADPFLAFIRRAMFDNKTLTIEQGLFTAVWTLMHVCKSIASGVGEPLQVCTLRPNGGFVEAKELRPEQLDEHKQAVDGAEAALRNWRNPPAPAANNPPPEPPTAATTKNAAEE